MKLVHVAATCAGPVDVTVLASAASRAAKDRYRNKFHASSPVSVLLDSTCPAQTRRDATQDHCKEHAH
ncbi:hypothetical protein I545_1883 [Mycobacterium kansasii 662]|uniref:Uncharacterized protein n=1 Tax=Mycobacterium kansasii 662 TaxID=1299326 RepID=X7ZLM0_MYCKA|nr:hypothetical protein I547_3674 [Mycobacterium kansasii 824]EUA19593.1 hypothetical protein I545_1883 [Mycobacterium kansasii 662]